MIVDDREQWVHNNGQEKPMGPEEIASLGGPNRYRARLERSGYYLVIEEKDVIVQEPKKEKEETKIEEIVSSKKPKKKTRNDTED